MLTGFFGFLGTVWEAGHRSRRLDPSLLSWVEAQPHPLALAISLALVAGLSTLLGSSVVLFINRVRGARFWFSILVNASSLVVLYLLQSMVVHLAGLLILGANTSLLEVVLAVMLASGPMVFGVLALFPFLGPWIARLLQVWSFVALWMLLTSGYRTGLWPALLVAGIGWGVMQFFAWAFARPMTWLSDRVWVVFTGRPSMLTGHDILAGHPFMPIGADSASTITGGHR